MLSLQVTQHPSVSVTVPSVHSSVVGTLAVAKVEPQNVAQPVSASAVVFPSSHSTQQASAAVSVPSPHV